MAAERKTATGGMGEEGKPSFFSSVRLCTERGGGKAGD